MRCRSGGSEPGGLWPDSGVHRLLSLCVGSSLWGQEQETREEVTVRPRRERMEAGTAEGEGCEGA